MPKRVVITGLGVISAAGQDKATFWNNIVQGNSGITAIEHFDASPYPARIAAQVHDFKVEDYILRKDARRMDLFVQYACAAARLAVEDAQLQTGHLNKDTAGVWVGSGIGGVETFEKQHQNLLQKGPGLVSPFFIPMFIPNMAAGQISIMLGVKGPNG
ncbi:MAG TPA: beta-ketoacyl-[acyl-carrier-protein] synthase II, partial [Syntrophomonas sp.]|nr:beta-ketoacyl-[acyl-carrier-protein] synthase II [Syntrophomonas sp.]